MLHDLAGAGSPATGWSRSLRGRGRQSAHKPDAGSCRARPGGPAPAWPAVRQLAAGDGDGVGNLGSLDWQAFSAAATFGSLGFSPLRKRSVPGDGEVEGGAVGRAVGIGSPCAAMQLRKAWNAVANWPPKPPNPPPLGRSDAHACLAACIAGLGLANPPLGRAVGLAVGRAVG